MGWHCFVWPALAQTDCTHFIDTDVQVIDGQGFEPGDVICLYPGLRSFLLFNNLNGTAKNPITIINTIGQVVIDTDHFYGVKFSHCSHIRFTGSGSDQIDHGIYIRRVGSGAGISVDDLSTNFELDHLRIANTALGGIYVKTDPDCSFAATRDNFTFTQLAIHNCWLHDIQDEGFYIGSAKYTGQYLPDCDTTVLPHLMEHVHIYNNLVERAGWDGIQVSSSPVDCEIYGNTIIGDSWRETPFQMSGILIGGGSKCDCYNNKIFDGKGDGIDIFGSGHMRIYNNLIVNAGRQFMPNDPNQPKHGIFVGNAPDNSSASLKIMHNTIVSPKTTGVRFNNSHTDENLFVNNIIVDPGGWEQMNDNAFFDHQLPAGNYTQSHNFLDHSIEKVHFINPATNDYDLQPHSPAINKALVLNDQQIDFDIDWRPRPHNEGYDIGAFECQDPFASADLLNPALSGFSVQPNPAKKQALLKIHVLESSLTDIRIMDASGRMVYLREGLQLLSGQNNYLLHLQHLDSGLYAIHLIINGQPLSRTFILLP